MSSPRRQLAAEMAGRAAELLAALRPAQRQLACWPFPADDERHRWYYTPTDHGGIAIGDLAPRQQQLVMRLLASGLSRPGYTTVCAVIGLDNVLDELEGWGVTWGRERGRDPGRFYLRIFGDPAPEGSWAWRFGGHHVSINVTVVDGRVAAVTPCFLGADPASLQLLGPGRLRPLAGAEDLARELVRSLDAEQRAAAVLTQIAPVDIVGANRARVGAGDLPLPLADVWRGRFEGELARAAKTYQDHAEQVAGTTAASLRAVALPAAPKGLAAGSMSAGQQQALRGLLDAYLRRVPDAVAAEQAAGYRGGGITRLAFAWAGGTEPGEGHYYRIQGPRLLIEYDNTQRGANHVHSVWRDPEGDFGDDLLRARPGR